MAKSDLHDRLTALRIEVPPEVGERQLAAISEAVRTAPPVRTHRRLGFRRRWAVAIASLTAIVAPVGTAVAAEGALPGELLYPVKQVSEQIRGVFDEDLPARHRVEELERLVDSEADRATIIEAQQRADSAVGALDQPGELAGRLEQVRQQVRVRLNDGPGQAPSGDVTPAEPGDGPRPTVGPGPGQGSGGDSPGSGDPSGDPDPTHDRDRDGSGGDGPPPTTGPGTGTGSGGSGSGGNDAGGDGSGGSGSGGSGSGGDGSGGDGSAGSGAAGDGSGGDGSGSGGNGSGSGAGTS